jgi:hypothetical protein
MMLSAKPTSKQHNYSWAVYHIRGTPAQFVGIVYDATDEQSAIAKAIEEYGVPEHQRPADRATAGLIAIKHRPRSR